MQEHLAKELAAITEAGLFKRERIITTPQDAVINTTEGHEVLNFCANNYLGLSSHPMVVQAAKDAIDQAFDVTQKDFGMCLIKGFPVHRWSVEDARLAHWGIGLNVGVARTQNQASQVMNDVRDEGGSYKV